MPSEKLLTLNEISEKLRVSRHTVQAWISPSSPNHRPEFAILARHAGRKTVFVENDVEVWLNQRRGAIYSVSFSERSAYWRERFVAGRGILKGLVKPPETFRSPRTTGFSEGMLAFDAEPLLVWLTDGEGAAEIFALAGRAEGLVLSIPLASWVLRRAGRNPLQLNRIKDFILGQNVFELAPFNEDALQRSLELSPSVGELSLQSYCCCIAAGAAMFITGNRNLLKTSGLSVSGF
ncbi:MAG: helix-turn-helix domain-containing protein [Candidatus Riflebacteria bacterium]|nr:helix-turn-helix domain-containing protein [Candidatus Riflebacteria bacterium]